MSLGLAVTALAAVLCVVGYLQTRVLGLERECERLRSLDAASGGRHLDSADVAALMARVGAAQARARKLADVYFAPAVIAELAALTTPPVHLLAVDLRLSVGPLAPLTDEARLQSAVVQTVAGRRAEARQGASGAAQGLAEQAQGPRLVIQGVLAGRRDQVDSELASYLMRLRQSPLLENPLVTERRVESVDADYLAFEPRPADQVLFFGVEAGCRQDGGRVAPGVPPGAATLPPASPPRQEEGRP